MISSLLGKKIGMTQVYDAQNVLVPVTVVEAGPCAVVQVKTEASDGYNAVQIGFSSKKLKNSSKAEIAHAKKGGLESAPRVLSEVRIEGSPALKVGDVITVTAFAEGQLVDVIGITKGKGFQGVVKRFRVGGGPRPTAPCSTAASARSACARPPAALGRTSACPATWAASAARSRTCASSRSLPRRT